MNAAVSLSDEGLRAPGEALCYVKEALAVPGTFINQKGGGHCNVVTLQKEEPLLHAYSLCLDNALAPLWYKKHNLGVHYCHI